MIEVLFAGGGIFAIGDALRELKIEAADDATWALRKNDEVSRQEHGFLDVVGDEDGGLGRARP